MSWHNEKNMLEQLEEIARAYCKKMNYTYKFGCEKDILKEMRRAEYYEDGNLYTE